MADEIDALLARIDDPSLRGALTSRIERLRNQRKFGLVFEDHLPETVLLPQHEIRRGTKVVPWDDEGASPSVVTAVDGDKLTAQTEDGETIAGLRDYVPIAEFGEPIYPGFKRLGSIERGGAKPAHTVINAENYHALEALQFTHQGAIDCIYIDPPYNTGDSDWAYNNQFVDNKDAYRYSKWISFMDRRLRLAKHLLAQDSILVVTIDEHEVSRLGVLLGQIFPEADVTLVTIVINPKGVTRQETKRFSRVEEYAYFCFFGNATLSSWGDDLLTLGADDIEQEARSVGDLKRPRWKGLLRSGTNAARADRWRQFYPVLVDPDRGAVVGVGESLPLGVLNR